MDERDESKMFKKVLVANRGEIALRVMRSLREMGISPVAVFSDADRHAPHVRAADEAYHVGPAASRDSYLRTDKIVEAAQQAGADAVHPGYGFLSERAVFAQACRDAGLVFIGPSPESITIMGDKTRARQCMDKAGVPLVPGAREPIDDAQEALELARQMGFPVLIKAAAGGGGKGMRRVDNEGGFVAAFEGARREAESAFGSGDVYIEKYLLEPKHVEIQILADSQGHTVHLFERDCSVQRRHQKIIEETPCVMLKEATRQRMGEVAVRAAEAVNYVGAGTVEFLVDAQQNFYFLEMNTRLQVEHPITELITGLDLVRWQVRIAQGEAFPLQQHQISRRGAAVECRIYAEDPEQNFMPAPGHISLLREPGGPGVRVDSGVAQGSEVTVHYDPMIAKLVTWGEDREHALSRMRRALRDYVVSGVTTNIAFHLEVLDQPDFLSGGYDTQFVPHFMQNRPAKGQAHRDLAELLAVLAAHRHDEALAEAGALSSANKVERSSRWRSYAQFRHLRSF